MKQDLDNETKRRRLIRAEVDKVLNIKDEKERLRAAFNLWLKVNPKIEVSYSDGARAWVTAKVAYKQTLEKVRFLKDQTETDVGTKATKNVASHGWENARTLMEFPPGSTEFMQMFAVDLFKGSGNEQKKAAYHLAKIFPELCVARKI